MRKGTDLREIVATNLRAVMEKRQWSSHKLADKSGIAQTTISNILRKQSSPTVETLWALARPLGVEGWQLQLKEFSIALADDSDLSKLVYHYSTASDKGRSHINSVAERESEYAAEPKQDRSTLLNNSQPKYAT